MNGDDICFLNRLSKPNTNQLPILLLADGNIGVYLVKIFRDLFHNITVRNAVESVLPDLVTTGMLKVKWIYPYVLQH